MNTRILVIEDNPANLDLMTYLLSAFGHTPLTADDGEAGLAAAQGEAPDLIICDVQLPGMDGYEIARWLKSHPQTQAIPLIAVTALAMVGDRDKMLKAGFDGYIAKPIDPETFIGQVESFLQRRRSPAIQAASSTALASGAGATILVVDNVPVNIELARSTLEPFGYQVIAAIGAEEALELARRAVPDLILSDVNMADGIGYDFIQTIKSDPQLSPIPFLFITSTFLEPSEQARGLELGADNYIIRPIDPQALLAAIESCLRQRGLRGCGEEVGG
jgi:two-component system, cell cycle response regulator